MVLFQRKLYFSKDSEGVQHFPGGGVQLLPGVEGGGGVQTQISIETLIACDFQGRSPDPLSSLWIRTCFEIQ